MSNPKFFIKTLFFLQFFIINFIYAQDTKPMSDPSGDWVQIGHLSDEFTDNSIKQAGSAYKDSVPSWGGPTWCYWHKSNSSVSNDKFKITMTHDPNNYYNSDVANWSSNPEGLGEEGTHVQRLHKRSGIAALEFYDPDNYYRIYTNQTKTGLTNGMYTLKAWVWSSGNQESAVMKAESFGGSAISNNIVKSSTWTQITINNINVTNGTCKVGFRVESYGGPQFVRIDDVEFFKNGTSTNLLTNPDFETMTTNPYKSGIIRSKDPIVYGYYEAKIKGSATNTASAFWLYKQSKGKWSEIDIVEGPQHSNTAQGAKHKLFPTTGPSIGGSLMYNSSFNPTNDYHVYGLDWYPGGFKVYVDGNLVHTHSQSYFDTSPMYLVLSMGRRGITQANLPTTMEVEYLRVWKKGSTNKALYGKATQSSTHKQYSQARAYKANDGITDGDFFPDDNIEEGSVSHTDSYDTAVEDWWEVDLGKLVNIDDIKIYNRTDCCADRLSDYHVFISDVPFTGTTVADLKAQDHVEHKHYLTQAATPTTIGPIDRTGRYVRIQQTSKTTPLSLAEVQVNGDYATNIAKSKTASQSSTLTTYATSVASSAVDGNTNGDFFPSSGSGSVTHTNAEQNAWWKVDLGSPQFIDGIDIWNRTDCCADRGRDLFVMGGLNSFSTGLTDSKNQSVKYVHQSSTLGSPSEYYNFNTWTRYIKVQLNDRSPVEALSLAEVQVFKAKQSSFLDGYTKTKIGIGLDGNVIKKGGKFYMLSSGASEASGVNGLNSYFLYSSLTGDGEITVKVESVAGNYNSSEKAGLLMTESLTNSSKLVMLYFYNADFGGVSGRPSISTYYGDTANTPGQVFQNIDSGWLRLKRQGNTFITYYSTDGSNWTQMHSKNVTMGNTIYIGLAASSSSNTAYTQAVFSDVSTIGATSKSASVKPKGDNSNQALNEEHNDDLLIKGLVVHPNPVGQNEVLKVNITTTLQKDKLDVRLINISGQEILNRQINLTKGVNEIDLKLKGIANGIYFMNFKSSEIETSKKILINSN